MKYATWLRMIVVLFVFAALATLPSIALAQDDDDNVAPDVPVEGDPAMYPDLLDLNGESLLQPAEADLVLAQPPFTMNYQGYLTDNSGVPVDGLYDFEARLYDASAGGAQEWGPETHNDVPVKSGLFNLVLGSTSALNPNDFDEALFLQLTVAGTTLPRQPLRTTAYAFGLVPGAQVEGSPTAGTNYALYVNNTAGDVGINSLDFVLANGYRSSQDSYVFVPGQLIIPPDGYDSAFVTINPRSGGSTEILSKAVDDERAVYLPIQLPAVLFGQNVTIENIVLYYWLERPDRTFITQVLLERRSLTDDTVVTMVNFTDDLEGTNTVNSASFTPTNATLSSSTGPISLRILCNFGNTGDVVKIFGARLRLGHQ
jgi:hypothetical protein